MNVSTFNLFVDRLQENCTGFEFAASHNGQRIMMLSGQEGFTNLFLADDMRQSYWKIPDHWTYEQAATVPVVYSTVSSNSTFLFLLATK